MILLLERIPNPFVLERDWKILLSPKTLLLAAALLLPLLYIRYDPSATFQLILIAYLVLGIFLLARVDFRKKSGMILGGLLLVLAVLGYVLFASRMSHVLKWIFTPEVLLYFFPNPPQQGYFRRLLLIAPLGILFSGFSAWSMRKKNEIPLFLWALLLVSLTGFLLVDKPDRPMFRARFLQFSEIWYLLVLALGLLLFFSLAKRLSRSHWFQGWKMLFALLGFAVAFWNLPHSLTVASDNPYYIYAIGRCGAAACRSRWPDSFSAPMPRWR